MKFVYYLEKISGVNIYALSSFVFFFLFFLVMLTWVIKADKEKIKEVSRIPLDANALWRIPVGQLEAKAADCIDKIIDFLSHLPLLKSQDSFS